MPIELDTSYDSLRRHLTAMRRTLEFALDREIPQWVPNDLTRAILDLGPGNKEIHAPDIIRLDYPGWDAEVPGSLGAFHDNSVGGIYAINLLEHLSDPRPLIEEMCRVLAPGCPATIWVPHARSGMYLQDLDHKTPFILDTWKNHLDSHPYYYKGRNTQWIKRVRIGVNVLFGLKEENVGILTQLVKKQDGEE
jgi:SAM-dependent methyltransferase